MSPSCGMHLKAHILISDFSLCLDFVIKHNEWDQDDITISSEKWSLSLWWFDIFSTKNNGCSMLNSICQDIAIKKTILSLEIHLLHAGCPLLCPRCRGRHLHLANVLCPYNEEWHHPQLDAHPSRAYHPTASTSPICPGAATRSVTGADPLKLCSA